jgi:hypothetical protein
MIYEKILSMGKYIPDRVEAHWQNTTPEANDNGLFQIHVKPVAFINSATKSSTKLTFISNKNGRKTGSI